MPDELESGRTETGAAAGPERGQLPDETLAGETATLRDGTSHPGTTERRPAVGEAPSRAGEDAGERDAGETSSRPSATERAAALVGLVRRHRVAAGLTALAVLALVTGIVLAITSTPGLPSRELVERDARELLATPAYDPGSFGWDDIIVRRDVEVRSVRPGDGEGRAVADVLVTYEGESVSARQAAEIDYSRVNGSWHADGEPRDVRVSWEEHDGIDPEKLSSGKGALLARADGKLAAEGDDGGTTLSQLYATSDLSVDSYTHDPETATCFAELTLTRPGTFETYSCHMSVTLSFRTSSGQWEIEELEVADGAKARSLEPLTGTWLGTFVSQETDGTKCLAAREEGLTLVVESSVTEAGVTQVTGVVSGVAHYHDHPAQDAQSCQGDLSFSEVPLTATLTDDSDGTLVLEGTLPEDVGGVVSVVIRLGEKDRPSAATVEVTTSYSTTGSIIFIPYERTLTYTDTFSLSRAT